MKYKIKQATQKDSEGIYLSFTASWQKWLNKDEHKLNQCLKYIQKRIAEGTVLIIWTDEKDEQSPGEASLGYLIYFNHWNTIHIDDIYITPLFRGDGLGTMLLKKVIEIAKKENVEAIYTDCDIDNEKIQKLNLSLGFNDIGTLTKFWDKDCKFFKYTTKNEE